MPEHEPAESKSLVRVSAAGRRGGRFQMTHPGNMSRHWHGRRRHGFGRHSQASRIRAVIGRGRDRYVTSELLATVTRSAWSIEPSCWCRPMTRIAANAADRPPCLASDLNGQLQVRLS